MIGVLAEELNFGELEVLELRLARSPAPPWLAHGKVARLPGSLRNPTSRQRQPREGVLRHPVTGGADRVVIHSADGHSRVEASALEGEVLRRVLAEPRQAVTWVAQQQGARLFVH